MAELGPTTIYGDLSVTGETHIDIASKLFLAQGSSTNINTSNTLSWDSTTFNDSVYTWDGSSNLTLDKAGRYEIHAEADFTSSGASRENPNLFIERNGSHVGVAGRSGYMRDAEGHNHSSVHAHAVINGNSGDTIDVTSVGEADTGSSVTPDNSHFYVLRIEQETATPPSAGFFDSHLTTTQTDAENGMYVNFADSVNRNDGWIVDSSSQITPQSSGTYKVEGSVNFRRTGTGDRNIMYAELEVNGNNLSSRTRGVCYIRSDGNGDEGDATFSTVIDLAEGDDIHIWVNEERGGQTGNDIERASLNITRIH